MSKEYRLEQIEKEIQDIEWMAFWTATKEAENKLRKLKNEKSQLEAEIARDYEINTTR